LPFKCNLQRYITGLPTDGGLYALPGKERILHVPHLLSGAGDGSGTPAVQYVPTTSLATADTFEFAVSESSGSGLQLTVHHAGVIAIVVDPINTVPRPRPVAPVSAAVDTSTPVQMSATFGEGGALRFFVSTLPDVGTLHQTADGKTPGAAVAAPGEEITFVFGSKATLVYSSAGVVFDPRLANPTGLGASVQTSFGFTVEDAATAGKLLSEELVRVTVAAAAGSAAEAFSGARGAALLLDGADDWLAMPTPGVTAATGVTLEAWVLSTGATYEGSTLAATDAWHLSWTRHGGLGLHAVKHNANMPARAFAPLHSGSALNDGRWHHVALVATPAAAAAAVAGGAATSHLRLYVDTKLVASTPSASGAALVGGSLVPADGLITVGRRPGAAHGARTHFGGQLDELRVFAAALSVEDIAAHAGLALLRGEPHLVSYVHFNYKEALVLHRARDAVAGLLVSVHGDPVAVTSTAPVAMRVTSREDTPGGAVISLVGADYPSGALQQVLITAVPVRGSLQQMSGDAITAVPAKVTDAKRRVRFVPDQHSSGDAAAEPPHLYATFTYTATEAATGFHSEIETVTLVVTPVNHAPVLTAPDITVDVVSALKDVTVGLMASDPDGDAVTFTITTLPSVGLLLFDNSTTSTAALTPVTARGTLLPAGVSSVVYRPAASASPSPVTFGYTAMDSNGAHPTEGAYDAFVTMRLPQNVTAAAASASSGAAYTGSTPLMAGTAGYALALDGSARLVASNLKASATGSFAVEAWIKASGGQAHHSATIVATDGFKLLASRIAGLSLEYVSSTDPATNLFTLQAPLGENAVSLHDGTWHFVAATYDVGDAEANLWADGVLLASRPVLRAFGPPISAGPLVIGAGFGGLVDEVRAWHRALSPKDGWDANGLTPLTGREPGLVAWYPFNDASQAATSAPSASSAVAPAAVLYAPTARSASYIQSGVPPPNAAVAFSGSTATPLRLARSVPAGALPSSVVTRVVTLPAKGHLFQSDGVTPITHANTAVSDPAGVVMYRPRMADKSADSADFIAYACTRGGAVSAPAIAHVSVLYLDAPPKLLEHSRSAVCSQGGAVQVFAIATPGAEVRVTKLPGHGVLRQVKAGATAATVPGDVIREVGTAVTHPEGLLVYTPQANVHGAPLDSYAVAAYHPGSALYSKDSLVPVTVYPDYALSLSSLSGVESTLLLPLGKLAPLLSAGGAFTLEMYLKSTRGAPPMFAQYFMDFETGGGAYDVSDFAAAARAHAAVLPASPPPPPSPPPVANATEGEGEGAEGGGAGAVNGTGNATAAYPLPPTGPTLGSLVISAANAPGPPLRYPRSELPLAVVSDSRWHHIAAVYDGSVKAVYVDGRLDLSQAVTVVDKARNSSTATVALHLREAAASIVQTYARISGANAGKVLDLGAMDGYVDGVRVWGTAWSGRELQARAEAFAAASTPAEAALLLNSRGAGAGRPPAATESGGLLFEETFDTLPGGVLPLTAAPPDSGAALVTVSAPVAGPSGLALRVNAATEVSFFGGGAFNISDDGYTAQTWFRTSGAVSELGTLVSKGTLNGRAVRVNSGQWALQWTPLGGLGFHVQLLCDTNMPGIFSANAGASYADGAWHHVVGTWDGSVSRVYVDGELQGTSNPSPCPSLNPCPFVMCVPDLLPATWTMLTKIGRDFDASVTSFFDGEIDDLAMFSAPLTAFEIQTDYVLNGGRVNTQHAAFSVLFDFNAVVDLTVTGANVVPSTSKAPHVVQGTQKAVWTSSGTPVRSLAHVYNGKPACVEISGSDGDGDEVAFSVVTMPTFGRAFIAPAPGCDPNTGDAAGPVGAEILFAGQTLDPKGAVVFYPGRGMATAAVPKYPLAYDRMEYAASDGKGRSAPHPIVAFVHGNNLVPTAVDVTLVTHEDAAIQVTMYGSDPEDGAKVGAQLGIPLYGTLSTYTVAVGAPLEVFYTPPPNFHGVDTFVYSIVDAAGGASAAATVKITVTSVNDPPQVDAPEAMQIYGTHTRLTKLSVSDVDAGKEQLDITIYASYGLMSTVSKADAERGSRTISLRGGIVDLNAALGNIFYYNSMRANTTITVEVSDGGFSGAGGVRIATKVIDILVLNIPLESVAFTKTGLAIEVGFTGPIELSAAATAALKSNGGDGACAHLFAAATVATLGSGAECQFIAPKTVRVAMGSAATIQPGDQVVTLAGAASVVGTGGLPMPAFDLEVLAPLDAIAPTAVISGATTVGACDRVNLDGRESLGDQGRPLSYEWGVGAAPRALVLAVAKQTTPNLDVDQALLKDGTSYVFTLKVTNFLQQRADAQVTVTKSAAQLPAVIIAGSSASSGAALNVPYGADVRLSARATPATCRPAVGLVFQWRVLGGPGLAKALSVTDKYFLFIPKGTLKPTPDVLPESGVGPAVPLLYIFEVVVYDASAPLAVARTKVEVSVTAPALVAAISGGGAVVVTQPLVLDGSSSADPSGASAQLSYRWACAPAAACAGVPDLSGVVGGGATLTIPADSVAAGASPQFTLTVSAPDGRFAAACVAVTGVPPAAPAVSVSANYALPKHRASDKLTLSATVTFPDPTSITWTVVTAPLNATTCAPAPECGLKPAAPVICDATKVSTTGCSGATLQLRSGALQPGRYVFTAAVAPKSGGGASSSASIAVVVNSAPLDGIISTSPAEGEELVTVMRLKAVGFTDPDDPMTYEFGYLLRASAVGGSSAVFANLFRPLSPVGSAYVMDTTLPTAAAETAVRVKDAMGASSIAHMPVNVAAFKGNATQLGDAVIANVAAAVDAPAKSGDASAVAAGVYLLSASLNAAPVPFNGTLAGILGGAPNPPLPPFPPPPPSPPPNATAIALLNTTAEGPGGAPVIIVPEQPEYEFQPLVLSPEAAEVMRRRGTRQHLTEAGLSSQCLRNIYAVSTHCLRS
jgi:hypothetical protein